MAHFNEIPVILNTLPGGSEKNAINEIINDEKMSNTKMTISDGVERDDNYVGIIQKVVIEEEDLKRNAKKLNLILKSSARTTDSRELLSAVHLFGREIFMYKEVLPAFLKLENERGIKTPFQSYPKFYKSSVKNMDEYLILADKKAEGFILAEKKIPLNLYQCKLVLNELGHYHALSFALKKYHTEVFDKLAKQAHDFMGEVMDKDIIEGHYARIGETTLKTLRPDEDKREIDVFTKFSKTMFEQMMKFAKTETYDKYSVILHGDCWSNNLLFKYGNPENPDQPTEVSFLDWQVSRYASPVLDLSYFIYCCTGTKLRNMYFDHLIDIYYRSLQRHLKNMECNVESYYPRRVLEEHMKKYFAFGLDSACSIIPMSNNEEDEFLISHKFGVLTDEEITKLALLKKNTDFYEERMRGVIKHAVAKEFI